MENLTALLLSSWLPFKREGEGKKVFATDYSAGRKKKATRNRRVVIDIELESQLLLTRVNKCYLEREMSRYWKRRPCVDSFVLFSSGCSFVIS